MFTVLSGRARAGDQHEERDKNCQQNVENPAGETSVRSQVGSVNWTYQLMVEPGLVWLLDLSHISHLSFVWRSDQMGYSRYWGTKLLSYGGQICFNYQKCEVRLRLVQLRQMKNDRTGRAWPGLARTGWKVSRLSCDVTSQPASQPARLTSSPSSPHSSPVSSPTLPLVSPSERQTNLLTADWHDCLHYHLLSCWPGE